MRGTGSVSEGGVPPARTAAGKASLSLDYTARSGEIIRMNDTSPLIDGPPALDFAGTAATITFRRPREHNRIDPDDIGVVRGHLEAIAKRPEVCAVVLTGTGGTTFSSGFTLGAIVERLDRSFEDLLDAIERCPLPTIC